MRKRGILLMMMMVVAGLTAGAQKKKEITTSVNVNYCLPKVVYDVKVILECTRYVPGPYVSYAEKELGIKPEIVTPKEKWSVSKIEITPRYIPDEKAVYSVAASGDYQPVMLRLTAEGFLSGVSAGQEGVYNEEPKMKYICEKQNQDEVVDILELSSYNNLKEVLDSNYTMQQVDGVMKKIWDPIVRYTSKTSQDNVKEAVNEIFRIRSERVKLLGAENNVPDGKSLAIILKEFDRMEKDYLSLFLGQSETSRSVRIFECMPGKSDEAVNAFSFSEEKGVASGKNAVGVIYQLKIENAIVPSSAPAVANTNEGAGIFYRIPATADLKLVRGRDEVMSFPVIVPQLGDIKKFPVDIISAEGMALEFYPQYGAIKSIGKVRN